MLPYIRLKLMLELISLIKSSLFRLSGDQEKLSNKRQDIEGRVKKAEAERSKVEQELNQQASKKRNFEDNIRSKLGKILLLCYFDLNPKGAC